MLTRLMTMWTYTPPCGSVHTSCTRSFPVGFQNHHLGMVGVLGGTPPISWPKHVTTHWLPDHQIGAFLESQLNFAWFSLQMAAGQEPTAPFLAVLAFPNHEHMLGDTYQTTNLSWMFANYHAAMRAQLHETSLLRTLPDFFEKGMRHGLRCCQGGTCGLDNIFWLWPGSSSARVRKCRRNWTCTIWRCVCIV